MNPTQKQITQSVAKAAAKTFAQAALAVLVLLLVPVLTNWAIDIQNGKDVVVDLAFFQKVLIAAVGGGVAALISFAQNSLKS
jgi:uncharacterized membrane protein